MWEPRNLSLGEIGVGRVVLACSRCSPSKVGNSHYKPSNSCNACFGSTYRIVSRSLLLQYINSKICNLVLRLGVNGGLAYRGTTIRHKMYEFRQVGS